MSATKKRIMKQRPTFVQRMSNSLRKDFYVSAYYHVKGVLRMLRRTK